MSGDDAKKVKRANKREVEEAVDEAVDEAVSAITDENDDDNDNETEIDADGNIRVLPKKRRLCRYPGCTKVIKSQGHCQRHGARAKRCKVDGCDKQAQGTHDGMCKRHWKQVNFPPPVTKTEDQPPPPEGDSVWDTIVPASISYRPTMGKNKFKMEKESPDVDPPPPPEGVVVMPLVAHLREGDGKDAGWHRNAERRARGMHPVSSLSSQLEPWERQLALVEILLLSGGTPYANFRDLSHAWGREKGFHHLLASSVCERRGEVERKKRSDAGRVMTDAQRNAFKEKLNKSKLTRGDDSPRNGDCSDEEEDDEDLKTQWPTQGRRIQFRYE